MTATRILAFFVSLLALSTASFGQGYKMTGSIPVGGTGGWDYLTADSQNRRLYVSHGATVEVIDLDTQKPAGRISGFKGVHGIAIADDLGLGFISDGGSNQVVSFDLKTLAIKEKIDSGKNPDGILYDPFSKRVFSFNGRSGDSTAIDASTGKVAGTIALGSKPEFPASDGAGSIFVNMEEKNEIVRIDPKSLAVTAHWSISPCESPSGLAIDAAHHRLFAVCGNKMMAVVDSQSGKVVATPAIGDGPDAASYDPGTHLAFSSNGEGTVTVIRETGKDQYSVAETVPTAKSARTMTLDTKTHTLYLSAASLGAAPAPTADRPHPRPSIVPDSFKVLIVAK